MEEFDPEVACQKLREMRDDNVRDSRSVVDLGERLIRKYSHRFGDEMWLICEQVFLASLDTCRHDLAEMCLGKLERRFPDSMRVEKLQAISMESCGEYGEALRMYDEILKKDETNAAVRKRKTAIFKAQGRTSEAIKNLTEYLKTFMADSDAWMELAELYTEELEYSKAAYCMEEVILMQPYNHLIHQRYAEIRYSQGGADNLTIAREHFAQALYFSQNSNIRALYGLMLASSALMSGKGSEKDDKKRNRKYTNWAARMISWKYKVAWEKGDEDVRTEQTTLKEVSELTSSVTELLDQMHINST